MIVNGIIAEYNPFHNGHSYHIAASKAATGADYTIIVMSGNFVQRGAPALLDKYKRAEMALQGGADIVVELPTYFAASSAEYFASGAVALLDKLGIVTHLCFGSECGNIEVLKHIASILSNEPGEYTKIFKQNLREGMSYPLARTEALLEYDASLSSHRDVFSSPNNILGLEYLKALLRRQSTLQPYTTLRVGSDYHDKRLNEKQSSALAIRHAIFSEGCGEYLAQQMPPAAHAILLDYLKVNTPMHINDFSAALHYKLLSEVNKGYMEYLDVSEDLSDRIVNHLYEFNDAKSFCDLLKSKEMTHTRISRCLLHILLDMTKDNMGKYRNADFVPYARVLGFRRDAAPLLSAIKENSSIPMVTKLADGETLLSPDAYEMLLEDIRINSIYASTLAQKSHRNMNNEYRTPIVIV